MQSDKWAQKAKDMGYRSRAIFKLEEILKKTNLKKISNVLDLGSAPGGWSQFIIKKYSNSRVFAVDILDMKKIDGVDFFQTSIEDIQEIHEIDHMQPDEYDKPIRMSRVDVKQDSWANVFAKKIFYGGDSRGARFTDLVLKLSP